jgi:hypothetical protein
MRRLFANLALAAILSGFALPLAVSSRLSQTPACCLPGGKHHCRQSPPGEGLKDKNDTCPFAPPALAIAVTTAIGAVSFTLAESVIVGYFEPIAVESDYRVAIRELSARGPPVVFL